MRRSTPVEPTSGKKGSGSRPSRQGTTCTTRRTTRQRRHATRTAIGLLQRHVPARLHGRDQGYTRAERRKDARIPRANRSKTTLDIQHHARATIQEPKETRASLQGQQRHFHGPEPKTRTGLSAHRRERWDAPGSGDRLCHSHTKAPDPEGEQSPQYKFQDQVMTPKRPSSLAGAVAAFLQSYAFMLLFGQHNAGKRRHAVKPAGVQAAEPQRASRRHPLLPPRKRGFGKRSKAP